MWDLSVPVSGQVAVTISSNIPGAYFSLEDGSFHQAPISFYWYTGAQHTVTWQSPPGPIDARYIFQNWSDSSTANPRTIAVPAAGATYTGNVVAQYLLTTVVSLRNSLGLISNASAGSLAMNPASPDGFYNSGQTVTITATPAWGDMSWQFFGEVSPAYSPGTVTMSGPLSVTAAFICDWFTFGVPNEIGPGPLSGMLIWPQAAGCQTSATSDSAWLALGPQTTSNGFNVVPYSIPENTGGSRVATVTFSGDLAVFEPTAQLTQDPPGSSLPGIVSVSPNGGSAPAQVFSLQAYDPGGYAQASLGFQIGGLDGLYCDVGVYGPELTLSSDEGDSGWLTLPGTATVQNSRCMLSAATSSVSGSGTMLTVNLGMSFTPAFAGSRWLYGSVSDQTTSISSPLVSLGTWSVSAGPPLLTVIVVTPANPSIAKGLTQQFTATGTYNDSTTQNLTSQVTWSSGATATATITTAGQASGVAVGTSTISAALGSVSSSTLLTVAAATLQSIAVTPASPSIVVGTAQQFTATGTYSDSSTANLTASVTWNSATTTVATIAPGGLATGVGPGTSNITASLNGVTSPADVLTATATTLQSIAVTPANPSIVVGTAQQFTATGTYSDSSTQNLTGQVIWASATIAVATITVAGKAAGVKVGASMIGATLASVSGSTSLTVTPLGPCDVTQQGTYTVIDVQGMINEVLGVAPAINDLNGDGVVNVVDIQIVIDAVLNLGCTL
jgi:hypothetical protein